MSNTLPPDAESITLTADEILAHCNRYARFIAHDDLSAEAAANGAAAHILLMIGDDKKPTSLIGWKIMCKGYVSTAYKREHARRGARVSTLESEFNPGWKTSVDGDLESDVLSVLHDAVKERSGESRYEVERLVEFREMKAELDELIEGLESDKQKKLLRLLVRGFTIGEAADIQCMAFNDARKMVARARKNLREGSPDVGKYTEFLLVRRVPCNRENYFKRARQGETDRYIRQGKRTHGYDYRTAVLL